MIVKSYKCDLCHSLIAVDEGKRIRWEYQPHMTFLPIITSESASEDIICHKCIDCITAKFAGAVMDKKAESCE